MSEIDLSKYVIVPIESAKVEYKVVDVPRSYGLDSVLISDAEAGRRYARENGGRVVSRVVGPWVEVPS